jgi:GNAT superfamily N-acetyltransferase
MSAGVPKLKPRSLDAVHEWWAGELGMSVPELAARAEGVTLSASANMPGIFIFRRGGDTRIASLRHRLEKIHDTLLGQSPGQIFSADFWRSKLPEWCGQPVGPAQLFYLDTLPAWRFAAPPGFKARDLAEGDAPAFWAFAGALTELEREEAGVDFGPRPLWGIFSGGMLVAVAGYDAWPGRIAHIGVVVHPGFRGMGLGKLAVQYAMRGAIARGRVVQYRTLATNAASLGVARSLGLVRFAETLYIRHPERT